ncbi:conjugal transfer protein TraG N-terminal domain-containing protein [Orientia tsutsugamushi]|uniref:conjugal transfer protein TraG N-terminal domain-containing protein n=1 Tax=Orientia tsutsugamushi TaxID=784 RepID=UPI000D5A51D9|nr:conjugal transfer protein TraG [Orientia tsutsugamushi]
MKPYIIGNILGKKAAAQQTNDIIGFIEQNIPNNFGIYYRELSNLGISFKTCRQATPLIKAAIHKELNEGLLTKFAAAIGVQSDQSSMLSQRLKVMTGDTLKYLQREQQDIHEWMKQAMLLNANRESYDDWREKFSLSRIYPNLVSMHAIRGLFQQSFSYLVAGEMAAHMMPILQSVFFALVVSMIFIVFPMGLLPGGYNRLLSKLVKEFKIINARDQIKSKSESFTSISIFVSNNFELFNQFRKRSNILKTWILLIIWVSSWPVFFTIIHCLGMISLSSKSGAFGSDYGLNMLSQGSFAEMILYSYATFQMLASSIPMLSWGVLKACAHATANLASQFSPIPVASSLGSNIVDNNLSMDNYSIGNRTISQQNLAHLLYMPDNIIDDGSYRVVTGNNGDQFVTQDSTAYHNKGYVLSMLKRYSEAIESCNLAIKYNPNCAEAYYRRGMIFEKLGEHQKAIENYDIAIKYKPNFAENYLEKGISLVSLGQYSKAKGNFNLAIKYMPNLIEEYELTIKKLTELNNSTIAKDYEQKLQILKKYS